jgi:ATP-dependent DNA helicase RecG
LRASLDAVAGVGPKRLAALKGRGLTTFLDAILHLPHRYEDLRRRDRIQDLRAGGSAVIEGTLESLNARPMRGMRWRRLTTAVLKDATGARIRVAWFNLRGDGQMPVGEPVLLSGRVTAAANGALEMLHPEMYRLKGGTPPAIRPLYRLPPDFPQRLFWLIVSEGLTRACGQELDAMPSELQAASGLPRFEAALAYLHRPPPDADLAALTDGSTPAHQALAMDEMFTFQLALAQERSRGRRRSGATLDGEPRLSAALIDSLPFAPTPAQRRAMAEISADLATPAQMNRLLMGDVGSGKTLVAFHAIMRAVESGWQAVMMAPTELLAEQHFRNFTAMSGSLGVTSALFTGKLAGAERARMLRAAQRGDVAVAFGTHALFQESVRIGKLGLAVIDEQHRFGVLDRARLVALGAEANVLLMTATPIPRSLALTLLRNLVVSRLDELPPGRTPVATHIYDEDASAEVDRLVLAELEQGRRAYYVLPLIDGDDEDAASVSAAAKRLTTRFAKFGIGVLHGRMRASEKDRAMRAFRDGTIKVLVATTVVEVGVDVPEATIIVIAAAERYGLAQLHQLRGRVGRGAVASRCCLVVSRGTAGPARERLVALTQSANGNEVAELDLRTRGPGDLFGIRQTGALALRFGSFIRDLRLIERAGDLAEEWIRRDPGLTTPASAPAVAAIKELLALGLSFGDIG